MATEGGPGAASGKLLVCGVGERGSEDVISENAETFSEMIEMIEMILTDLAERWGGYGLGIEWTLDRAARRERDRSAIELPERISIPG